MPPVLAVLAGIGRCRKDSATRYYMFDFLFFPLAARLFLALLLSCQQFSALQALVERASTRETFGFGLDHDFLRTEDRKDYRFINGVAESSRDMLSIAIELAEEGILRYCPVRVFLRTTSASIFLLKAISFGSQNNDLQKFLDALDHCNRALQTSALDNVHLSARDSVLMGLHVRRFRCNFRKHSSPGNEPAAPPTPQSSAFHTTTGQPRGMQEPPGSTVPHGNIGDPDTLSGHFDTSLPVNDWLAQPFDPSVAPFGMEGNQSISGLDMDSLGILWNLTA
jgi:hypothetical protein